MYNINFEKYFNLINWTVIYWGIKNDLIEPDSAVKYANKIIKAGASDDSLIIEIFILDTVDKCNVLSIINKIQPQSDLTEGAAVRILRYVILDEIKQLKLSDKDTLSAVENVYSDFNYPKDMSLFIGYMPIENDDYNPSEHTLKENEARLIEKFKSFLEKELHEIK